MSIGSDVLESLNFDDIIRDCTVYRAIYESADGKKLF